MQRLVLLLAMLTLALSQNKYTDRYDNIDIDEILSNRRLLLPYVNCVLDRGRCTNDAKTLKDHIVDGLETGCSKCTEKQEQGVYRVMEHLIGKEAEIWKELVAKYDAKGVYRKKYEERALANGIKIPN